MLKLIEEVVEDLNYFVFSSMIFKKVVMLVSKKPKLKHHIYLTGIWRRKFVDFMGTRHNESHANFVESKK